MNKKYVVWFSEVDREDVALVGGKGANLGEMTRANFPVPAGFIITAKAYYNFLSENKLEGKIKRLIDQTHFDDQRSLQSISSQIKKLILKGTLPQEISNLIVQFYQQLAFYHDAKTKKIGFLTTLKSTFEEPFVAVRSSATAEDLPEASFAGQQITFLNVKGHNNLLQKVRECFASLFEPRAIFYRHENKFDHFKVGIAVPVQKMVNPQNSGVIFTVDPVTGDKRKIVIEAIYGLGEFIVQGIESPDQYIVDKYEGEITFKQIAHQRRMLSRKGNQNSVFKVPEKLGKQQKISNKQILQLAVLGKKLERHYFFPQDIEWAIEDGKIYLVQTRPITTLGKREKPISQKITAKPILVGVAASPGIATGKVKIIRQIKYLYKIKEGDVLVASQTNPDYVPVMKKVVAVLTEKGGRTSHAAIVSRELGLPAIVGVENLLTKLKDDEIITVDGASGKIYKGGLLKPQVKEEKLSSFMIGNKISSPQVNESPKTATKVYVNLAEPEMAIKAASLPTDGVGLLRAEFMIAQIGIHPKKLIHDKKQKLFIEKLASGIETICRAFAPRPVVYRATDFKTNEYRNLLGGKDYEPVEANPMLGFRGAYRYIASSDVFDLEISAIKEVRNKHNLKNLWLMIPFVRTVSELTKVKRILASSGLMRSPSFKLWMMVEIPSNVILLDKFIDCGIDGVSVGSNDLTMLILGTDRDNTEVAHVFNEQDEAVLWALEKVIKTCHKHKITSSICGQAVSDYPDLVEKLVYWGINSVSVNIDAINNSRSIIAEAEKRLLNKKFK